MFDKSKKQKSVFVNADGVVDYLCKYVRPDKVDGKYLGEDKLILNTWK